jgi:hypothetical protein
MKNGGGLVIVHAADNAFPGWKQYNEMIGIGGWRNRPRRPGLTGFIATASWCRIPPPDRRDRTARASRSR